MLTKTRRQELARTAFHHLGNILREKGVDTDAVADGEECFSAKDFRKALILSGASHIEADELLAEMDAERGIVN